MDHMAHYGNRRFNEVAYCLQSIRKQLTYQFYQLSPRGNIPFLRYDYGFSQSGINLTSKRSSTHQ